MNFAPPVPATVQRFVAGAQGHCATAMVALLASLIVATAAAAGPAVREATLPVTVAPVSTVPAAALASARGVMTVMVELTDPPASVVYAESMQGSVDQAGGRFARMSKAAQDAATSTAVSVAKAQVAKIEAAHQALLPSLRALASGGSILFRTRSAYNGVSMLAARGDLATIAKLPGVKAVHVQTPKYPTAASDVDFLGARAAWTDTPGLRGEGIKVAVIDSGLDYIHTNFGGTGTLAAYAAVSDTGPVPNAYFPSAKIPGGYDFAGDDYNAGNQPIPHPDANPFDSTNGHGTASASLVGGLGVAADGSTYVGSYDNSTNIASLKISPGFAPGALLFPLRVFGVGGSTNLVSQAIDWAVDPERRRQSRRPHGRDQHVARRGQRPSERPRCGLRRQRRGDGHHRRLRGGQRGRFLLHRRQPVGRLGHVERRGHVQRHGRLFLQRQRHREYSGAARRPEIRGALWQPEPADRGRRPHRGHRLCVACRRIDGAPPSGCRRSPTPLPCRARSA